MPSVFEDFQSACKEAFARGKTAGASDSMYELSQARAKNARLETEAADLRKAVADQVTPEVRAFIAAWDEARQHTLTGDERASMRLEHFEAVNRARDAMGGSHG